MRRLLRLSGSFFIAVAKVFFLAAAPAAGGCSVEPQPLPVWLPCASSSSLVLALIGSYRFASTLARSGPTTMTLDHFVMVRIHARQLIDIERLVAGLLAWRVSRRQFPDSARRHAKQLRSLNRDTVLPSGWRACEHRSPSQVGPGSLESGSGKF